METNNVFTCKACSIGPCIASKCIDCIHRGPKWLSTSKYKITKTTEPAWFLDIKYPVEERFVSAAHYLAKANRNKQEVEPRFESSGTWVKLGDGGQVTVPRSWLKQKPTEPTVEELQKVIDNMLEYSDKCSFNEITGNAHKKLCEIANRR
jgi:hypothetical protein